jgi:hypothetical protein
MIPAPWYSFSPFARWQLQLVARSTSRSLAWDGRSRTTPARKFWSDSPARGSSGQWVYGACPRGRGHVHAGMDQPGGGMDRTHDHSVTYTYIAHSTCMLRFIWPVFLSSTPSVHLYRARANVTRSYKSYFDYSFLLYYICYGYEFILIVIGKYIWLQIQPCQFWVTKQKK